MVKKSSLTQGLRGTECQKGLWKSKFIILNRSCWNLSCLGTHPHLADLTCLLIIMEYIHSVYWMNSAFLVALFQWICAMQCVDHSDNLLWFMIPHLWTVFNPYLCITQAFLCCSTSQTLLCWLLLYMIMVSALTMCFFPSNLATTVFFSFDPLLPQPSNSVYILSAQMGNVCSVY